MFHFRLQQVLDLREQRERHLATQLVRAMGLEHAAREALDRLRTAREAGGILVAAGQHRSVGELANAALLLQHLDGHIENAGEAVTTAGTAVTQTQDALTVALQNRRVLDRLKERDAQSFRATTEHSERREMDDVALARYVQHDSE